VGVGRLLAGARGNAATWELREGMAAVSELERLGARAPDFSKEARAEGRRRDRIRGRPGRTGGGDAQAR